MEPDIRWSKLSSVKPYSLGGRSCPLCLAEKTAIARDTSGQMLNRRRELMNRCLHMDPFKLTNFVTSQHTPNTQIQNQSDDDELDPPEDDQNDNPEPSAKDPQSDDSSSFTTSPVEQLDLSRLSTIVEEEHQQPPDPPVLDPGLPRRSRRVCKRRHSCLDVETL